MALFYTDDAGFEKAVEGYHKPKMVLFYASWCPHCHRMMPLIEEAAKLYDGKVSVFAVDVDKAPKASAKYAVRGIPTVLFFKNAKDYTSLAGERSLPELKNELDRLI